MAFYREGSIGDARFAESVMHSVKVIADNTTVIAQACKTKEEKKIKEEDIPEVIGEIIDTFEDFLDKKGVKIPKTEEDTEDAERDEIDLDTVNIFGSDYDTLSNKITILLKSWGII